MKILSWNCQGLADLTQFHLSGIGVGGIGQVYAGNSGGLGLWWRDLNIKVKSFSPHHIEVDVCRQDDSFGWRVVGVYGWEEVANKHLTWSLIRRLCQDSNSPTILFGDFNEILSMEEKGGGLRDLDSRAIGLRGSVEIQLLQL
ncbi:Elongation factor 1-alpha [Bienertia sinuspersici]